MAWNADDYIDVATRIAEFRETYPDGSLQPANIAKPYEIVTVEGATFIVYVAAAYRTQDDKRPGVGAAWEPVPGKTNFTRNSELMNAETSAWGRAIVAVLAADSKKGIASKQEVRNRQEEREDGPRRNRDGSVSRRGVPDEELDAAGVMTREQVKEHNALAKDNSNGKATRHDGAVDDGGVWETGEVATKNQLGLIRKLFADCQWSAKDDMLRAARALVGRPELESASDLTKAQASTLIDALKVAADAEDPPAKLEGLLAAVREQEGARS